MNVLEEISPLSEVLLTLEIELDRRIMALRDVLALNVGSVIRMKRSAGENVDILVGGSLTAFGELVIIEDTMGVRITDFNVED